MSAQLMNMHGVFGLDTILYTCSPDSWDGDTGTWTIEHKYNKYIIVATSGDEGAYEDGMHIVPKYTILSVEHYYYIKESGWVLMH